MINNSIKIVKENFKEGLKGDSLLIDISKIRNDFDYAGLWYAKDGNEETFITTEIYCSDVNEKPLKPDDQDAEIKENSFKQVNRIEISRANNWVWIASKVEGGNYCNMKTGQVKQNKLYINFKVVHNKTFGFDIVNKGIFKGGTAYFFDLISSYKISEADAIQSIMFLVFIKDLPPADWNIDDTYYGVENLPVFTPIFKFADDNKYSDWFSQNPLNIEN